MGMSWRVKITSFLLVHSLGKHGTKFSCSVESAGEAGMGNLTLTGLSRSTKGRSVEAMVVQLAWYDYAYFIGKT